MRGVGLCLALLLTGCLFKPDRPSGTAGPDAPTAHDSPAGDTPLGAAPTCANGSTALVFDAFDGVDATGAVACGSGASANESSTTILRGNGVLTFQPMAGVAGSADCTWDPFANGSGVIARFVSFATVGTNDVIELELFRVATDTSSWGTILQLVGFGPFVFKVLDQTGPIGNHGYAPTDLWWRVRLSGANDMIAEISSDGLAWTVVDTSHMTAAVTDHYKLNLGVNSDATDGNARTVVDGLYYCP
jgi:hypothetical protein